MPSTGQPSRKSALQEVVTISLDLARTSVQFVGLDVSGRLPTRRRYSKGKLGEVTAKLDPCRIGMEACCGAHHLGCRLLAQGHDVQLMPPKYVKPFVKRDETDTKDAEACVEACLRPTMRFVAAKSEAQLALQSLHRRRSRLVGNSTQLANRHRDPAGKTPLRGAAAALQPIDRFLADLALLVREPHDAFLHQSFSPASNFIQNIIYRKC